MRVGWMKWVWNDIGVGEHKKEVRLLTLPPCDGVYHALYFTFLANVLNGELGLLLNGDIPFVFQYHVLIFETSLVSSYT